MPLDDKIAPEVLDGQVLTLIEITRRRVCVSLCTHSEKDQIEELFVVRAYGSPVMVIDRRGVGRFIRRRRNQAFPYQHNVYVNKKRYILPQVHANAAQIVEHYINAVNTLTREQRME